jgi:hypothetical protein
MTQTFDGRQYRSHLSASATFRGSQHHIMVVNQFEQHLRQSRYVSGYIH